MAQLNIVFCLPSHYLALDYMVAVVLVDINETHGKYEPGVSPAPVAAVCSLLVENRGYLDVAFPKGDDVVLCAPAVVLSSNVGS